MSAVVMSGGHVVKSGGMLSVPGSLFPLTVDSSNRFLNDAQGNPFFLQGMSLWEMSVNPTRAQVITALNGMVAQGANCLIIEAVEHLFSYQTPPYLNVEGNAPWASISGSPPYTVDMSVLNAPYWNFIQYIQAQCLARGILILFVPLYYGFAGSEEGWGSGGEIATQTNTQLQAYGAALATVLAGCPNIVITYGGDNNSGAAAYQQIATGILSGPANSFLYSGHAARFNDGYSQFGTVSPFTLNSLYTGIGEVITNSATCYARSLPFFLIEDDYENESAGTSGVNTRQQKYQAVLSGAFGFMYSNGPLWSMGEDNFYGLNTPDVATCLAEYLFTTFSQEMIFVTNVMKSIQWWKLVPQTGLTLVTDLQAGQVCGALTSDGKSALIYCLDTVTTVVHMTVFSGSSVACDWFDVTNGTSTAVSGSPFANTGTHSFTSPGTNAGGTDSDWVLRLRS